MRTNSRLVHQWQSLQVIEVADKVRMKTKLGKLFFVVGHSFRDAGQKAAQTLQLQLCDLGRRKPLRLFQLLVDVNGLVALQLFMKRKQPFTDTLLINAHTSPPEVLPVAIA